MLQLSVVILNYNTRHFLELCLQSVLKAIKNIQAEVIVVDNASADESVAMVQSLFPQVICLTNSKNMGFSAGNNLGVKAARGQYVCLLNPDTLVAEDSFEILLQQTENQKNAGALGPRLIEGSGQFLPESKRGLPTPLKALFRMWGLHKIFPKSAFFNAYYAPELDEKENGPVDVLVGACFLVNRALYLKLGGLDERFFMYGEDIDLSYSIAQSGYQNYYIGTSTVLHFKGESALKETDYRKRFTEAMQLFYEKHYGKNLITNLMVRFLGSWYSQSKVRENQKAAPPPHSVYLPESAHLEKVAENYFPQSKIVSYQDVSKLSISENSLLVADVHQVCLKDLFHLMEKYNAKKYRFAFCDKNRTFILESSAAHLTGKIYLTDE